MEPGFVLLAQLTLYMPKYTGITKAVKRGNFTYPVSFSMVRFSISFSLQKALLLFQSLCSARFL